MRVHVVGYPKSGTTWLSRIIADVLVAPLYYNHAEPTPDVEHAERGGPHQVHKAHLWPIFNEKEISMFIPYGGVNIPRIGSDKIVHIIRDPRDVAVSVMYYWDLPNIHNAVACMIDGTSPLLHLGWLEYVSSWQSPEMVSADSKKRFLTTVRYEDLISNPYTPIFEALWWMADAANGSISAAIERQSFANTLTYVSENGDNLPFGRTTQRKLVRKGIIGDWKTHFKPDDLNLLCAKFEDKMIELGYDPEEKCAF